ncbi:hypothetical protein pipiens_006843 [Culex pipiens pipiens]|uniref:Uncharacterized protein n=1 Tax=Culex pipiens pipiens TaxID=38569 RepID=A0ABD1DNI1_CULPP
MSASSTSATGAGGTGGPSATVSAVSTPINAGARPDSAPALGSSQASTPPNPGSSAGSASGGKFLVWVILLAMFFLSVCGFERCDLNKTKRWEKLILLAVIVLMFFTTCAYETKLISLMSCPPIAGNIRTIQDLLNSGVGIKVNLLMNSLFDYYPMLRDIFVNSTDLLTELDGVHAYVCLGRLAETFLPAYYNREQKMNRYGILDQTFSMFVCSGLAESSGRSAWPYISQLHREWTLGYLDRGFIFGV